MTVTEFPGGVRVEGAEPFDLAQTLDCGQCFRFAPTGDGGWFGAAGGHAAGLRFEGESLVLEGATAAEFEGFWRDYLDLDRDYAAVRAAFARDPRLAPCVAFAPGIRVLRQPAFEALIAFIVSQNNNVPRIKGILARLCALFGEPLPGGARAFPAPERLAACSKEELAPPAQRLAGGLHPGRRPAGGGGDGGFAGGGRHAAGRRPAGADPHPRGGAQGGRMRAAVRYGAAGVLPHGRVDEAGHGPAVPGGNGENAGERPGHFRPVRGHRPAVYLPLLPLPSGGNPGENGVIYYTICIFL